jgi:hypothetical protein
VIILDTLVIGGLRFVLRRIAEAVDAERDDVEAIREALLAAQMRLELGEMSQAEFAGVERELLGRMREIRERTTEGSSGGGRIVGIDVSVADDVAGPSADDARGR